MKRQLYVGRLSSWLGLSIAIMAVAGACAAVVPSAALARTHEYCDNNLAPNEGCPPHEYKGGSEWMHIEANAGDDPYGSHAVCIDEFLDPSGSGYYTEATCYYYEREGYTIQYPGGIWGYPRAWNAGSITHIVYAWQTGY